MADEVEQRVRGQHQVLARVQAGRVVEDAGHRHRVVDLLLFAPSSEIDPVVACVPGH